MPDGGHVCDGPGCGNPATVHLTQIIDDKATTHYLCAKCAKARGVDAEVPSVPDMAEFLAQLVASGAEGAEPEDTRCDSCSMTFEDFGDSGRLGCPQCYSSFEVRLRRLLGRIHGASRHGGKVHLPPDPSRADRRRRLDWLRRSLRRAIRAEDYERAAVLRDQIRADERTEA